MDIRISKESDVPLREQISGQLVFLIATRKLKPGDTLPSVRALARTLKVHHNTVSEAFQNLVKWDLVVRRRGARLIVNEPGRSAAVAPTGDLDDVINELLHTASARGVSQQDILRRLRERALEQPPDHLLALSYDPGMCRLFEAELRKSFPCPVLSCSPEDLLAHPEMAIRALVISPPGVLPRVSGILPKTRSAIPVVYSDANSQLDAVRQLREPSLIVVASVSDGFLEIAKGLLGPMTSGQHSLIEYRVPAEGPASPPSADIVFCDVIVHELLAKRKNTKKVIPYQMVSAECLKQIRAMMSA
jgi:GntR family transcriptional regulator